MSVNYGHSPNDDWPGPPPDFGEVVPLQPRQFPDIGQPCAGCECDGFNNVCPDCDQSSYWSRYTVVLNAVLAALSRRSSKQ